MTDPDVRVLAWCGNSVYHDACDPGVYDDRCGACRRMFERLSTHHLEAGGTLQTALRQLVAEMLEFARTAPSGQQTRQKSAREMVDHFAYKLERLLPALEPIHDEP